MTSNTLSNQQYKLVLARSYNYNKNQEAIAKILDGLKCEILKEYRDTIRNLAIVSAAIATFSLMIIDSKVNKIVDLLIIGISLLLLNVVIAFTHLIRGLSRDSIKLSEQRMKFLKPIQDRTRDCLNCLTGKVTFKDWESREKDFLYNKHDELSKDLLIRPEKLSYMDAILLILFILAVCSIGLSFIIPIFVR